MQYWWRITFSCYTFLRKTAPERSHLLRFYICLKEIVNLIIDTVSWVIEQFPHSVLYQHYIRPDSSHAHTLVYVKTYEKPKGRFLVEDKTYYQYQVSVVYVNSKFFNLYSSGPGYQPYKKLADQDESEAKAYPLDDGTGKTNYRSHWSGQRKHPIASAKEQGGANKKAKHSRK